MSLLSALWAGQSWLLGCPSRQNLLPPSVGAMMQAEAPLLSSGAGGTITPLSWSIQWSLWEGLEMSTWEQKGLQGPLSKYHLRSGPVPLS